MPYKWKDTFHKNLCIVQGFIEIIDVVASCQLPVAIPIRHKYSFIFWDIFCSLNVFCPTKKDEKCPCHWINVNWLGWEKGEDFWLWNAFNHCIFDRVNKIDCGDCQVTSNLALFPSFVLFVILLVNVCPLHWENICCVRPFSYLQGRIHNQKVIFWILL